jgi:hypothetical protein
MQDRLNESWMGWRRHFSFFVLLRVWPGQSTFIGGRHLRKEKKKEGRGTGREGKAGIDTMRGACCVACSKEVVDGCGPIETKKGEGERAWA